MADDEYKVPPSNRWSVWEDYTSIRGHATSMRPGYRASIQMAPYEALYGRLYRSPLCLTEVGESSITGPDLIRDTS